MPIQIQPVLMTLGAAGLGWFNSPGTAIDFQQWVRVSTLLPFFVCLKENRTEKKVVGQE